MLHNKYKRANELLFERIWKGKNCFETQNSCEIIKYDIPVEWLLNVHGKSLNSSDNQIYDLNLK